MLFYLIAEAGRYLFSRLPAWCSYTMANITGDIVYFFWVRGRRNMRKSMASLLHKDVNDPQVKKAARRGMRNFFKYLIDIVRYTYPQKEFYDNNMELHGVENLNEALKEGKGVVLVSYHMGNLDLGIRWLGNKGYPINAIVNNFKSPKMNDFLQKPRTKGGVKLLNVDEKSSSFLNLLKRNEILALMIDCPNWKEVGVKVQMGAKSAILPAGAAILALRTGARVVPCGLVRTSNTTFRGYIGKAVDFSPSGKLREDIGELTQRTVHSMEHIVKPFVDQWYVFHPLIKDTIQDVQSSTPKPDIASAPVN